jgi:hypothetical protein
VIEFGLGINGYPFNHEWVFYVFESVPMLPAMVVFCIFHPAKYLPRKKYSDNEAVTEELK